LAAYKTRKLRVCIAPQPCHIAALVFKYIVNLD